MLEIRNGSVCSEPPKKVMIPVMPPRIAGLPRPVSSPLSESPSENAMLMPAPVAEAIPTRNVVVELCVAKAVAKMGARVETDPSMRRARPGCTTRKRKSRDETSLVLTALISSASCPLMVGGMSSISFVESVAISSFSGIWVCFSTLSGLCIGVFSSGDIRFLTGPLAGNIFQVNKPIITFGRDPGNDVVISDPTVSRKHAHLVNNAGQWSIEKLAEQNVVTVNQQNVQAAVISDRDTIGLGTGTTFLFLISSPQFLAEQRPVTPYNVVQRPAAQTPPGPKYSEQQPQVQYSFPEAASPLPTGNAQRALMDAYEPGTIVSGQTTPGIPMLEVSTNTH